jgi:hypothetical protein
MTEPGTAGWLVIAVRLRVPVPGRGWNRDQLCHRRLGGAGTAAARLSREPKAGRPVPGWVLVNGTGTGRVATRGGGEVIEVECGPAGPGPRHLRTSARSPGTVLSPRSHPDDPHQLGRLVPLDLLDTAPGEISLRCTATEFFQLARAENLQSPPRAGKPALFRLGGQSGRRIVGPLGFAVKPLGRRPSPMTFCLPGKWPCAAMTRQTPSTALSGTSPELPPTRAAARSPTCSCTPDTC